MTKLQVYGLTFMIVMASACGSKILPSAKSKNTTTNSSISSMNKTFKSFKEVDGEIAALGVDYDDGIFLQCLDKTKSKCEVKLNYFEQYVKLMTLEMGDESHLNDVYLAKFHAAIKCIQNLDKEINIQYRYSFNLCNDD